jgi:xanthine/CO dehydrogenase XdhC/CoxF family maturation factor
LSEQGLSPQAIESMTCPIGINGINGIQGKEPMVIAISVLAQLLQAAPPQA